LPQIVTRRFILQKARRQTGRSHSPPTACRQPVSGSISLPSRGAFHLSLTVLVHYRWPGVFSLGGWSPRIPPGFHVSRGTWVVLPSPAHVRYGTVTRSGAAFQTDFACAQSCSLGAGAADPAQHSHDPHSATPAGLARCGFRLFRVRSPLLAESRLISLPRGTKMFQFPHLPGSLTLPLHP
jgi:hypothetical protein